MSSYQRPIEITDDEILALPLDVLAMRILESITAPESFSLYNLLNSCRAAGAESSSAAMKALVEASEWLRQRGLVGSNPHGSPYNDFVTRLGFEALDRGIEYLGAVERMQQRLHPRIASVRSQFLLGEYELAAFAAMRAVEVRVRELGGYSDSDIGQPMMRNAFHVDSGPLRDPDAEKGERQGLSNLFAGAFSVFKNPTSHRVVTFDDPSEAAEIVSLANLLLRILERRSPNLDQPS